VSEEGAGDKPAHRNEDVERPEIPYPTPIT